MLSEINQNEKDKYFMMSIVCEIKKEQKIPATNRKRSDLWLLEAGTWRQSSWMKMIKRYLRYVSTGAVTYIS